MSREQRPETRDGGRGRKGRVPLGTPTQKLTTDHLNIPKDKVPRWVLDKPGRLRQALEGGYEFFRDPNAHTGEGNKTSSNQMGSQVTVGSGDQKLYLMVIDKDLYDSDQRVKQGEIDEMEKQMRDGNVSGGEHGQEKRYIPEEGIKIDSGKNNSS